MFTAMFIAGVTTGARNGFGVFVIPMSEELGFSRTGISVAAGLGWLMNGITQPLIGQLFDKFNSRWVILISLLVAGVSTAALSLTFNLYFLIFLFSFVLSTAMSGASIGTLMPLLARWFVRRRTLALGLVASGSSIGGMVLITFSGYLVQLSSWQVSWIALGGIVTLLALPIGYMFLRNDPGDMGLQPDGDPEPPGGAASGYPARRRGHFEVDQWYKSFRSPPIWNLSAAYMVCGITVGLLSVHFVPYADGELGIDPKLASLIFAILTGLNVIGAIGGGWLADRFGRKNVLGTVYSVRCVAYLALIGGLLAVQNGITLPIIGSPGLASLWVFAILAGFSWIASVPITASLTADVYGLRALATISGISFLCHQVGAFVSIILGGILYDLTGSYLMPFSIAAVCLIPAAIAAYTINEKKYSVRYQSAQAGAAAD
jgi:MFS family permease